MKNYLLLWYRDKLHVCFFEPSCRNNWQINHATQAGEQILICIEGKDWYQEEGKEAINLSKWDIIVIPANVKHFTFNWSNNILVGIFSPVNESIWEHLKLLFFPMLITVIFVYFYKGRLIPNYLCAKVLGIIVSIAFTIIFFYTY